jgi:prolyl oligopeptidase
MPSIRSSFLLVLIAAGGCSRTSAPPSPMPVTQSSQAVPVDPQNADPHQWLEDIEGEKSLAWVREHNTKSLGVLQGDARYQKMHDDALKILEARDRIAFPSFRGDAIENFWQDSANVRGIWRRTTLASYRTGNPEWSTILDVDALAKAEGANWVYRGADCLPPANRRCLINLSDGGKDATVVREFDRESRTFVVDGFKFVESKGGVTWLDENTVLVSRDFGPGTLTKSGYPYITKVLKRGQRLEDAQEIFRGMPDDVSAGAFTMRDADGVVRAILANRGLNFYEAEYYLIRDDWSKVRLPVPARLSIRTLVSGQLVFTTETDWRGFKKGDLLAYDLAELKANPENAAAYLVFSPGPRDAIQSTSNTRNRLIVSLTENVKGAVYSYEYKGNKTWTRSKIALPENSTLGIQSVSRSADDVFFTASNYLTPNSM